jgi:hypothetical protein
MILQAFKANLAITRDIKLVETAHFNELLWDGGIRLGHGIV